MAEAIVSRRQFFGHAAGAYTLVSTVGVATLVVPDPILAFIERWDAVIAEYERVRRTAPEENAFWTANVAPMEERCAEGDIPNATTAEGAAAAIRKALSYGDMERQDENLVRSALAFLEAQTA